MPWRGCGGLGQEGSGLWNGLDVELAQDLDEYGVGADRSCVDREAVAEYFVGHGLLLLDWPNRTEPDAPTISRQVSRTHVTGLAGDGRFSHRAATAAMQIGRQRCYDHPNGVSHEHGAAAPDRGRWRSGRVPSRQSLRTRGRRCRRDGRLRASVRSRGPAGRNLGGQLPPGRSGPPSRWEPQVALREVVAHRMRGRWARPSPGCGPTTVVGQAFPFDVATFVSARWASGTAPVQTSTNASDWTNLVTLHGRGCQSVGGRLAEQTERADRTGGSPSPAIPSITLPVISP